jgi:hypothetical protein
MYKLLSIVSNPELRKGGSAGASFENIGPKKKSCPS